MGSSWGRWRAWLTAAAGPLVFLLTGCVSIDMSPTERTTRLDAFPVAGLPLERPVTIRWNDYQIPFIEAETDRDLAFTLGLVHAHLRGGQMALMKRIATGRLSEMVGPPATDLDHALRILNFGYAVPEMERRLPAETRRWLEAFVAGLNHYQSVAEVAPPEFALLSIEPEPWTVADVLTIGRLAGTDVNWLAYFALLPEYGKPGWPDLWRRARLAGSGAFEGDRSTAEKAAFSDFLAGMSRSGSNSVAVAPQRSTSGGALLANDPHLGLTLPNLWVLAGVSSPSYHAVGLMVPGVPIIGLGRNAHMAWGGTNLRAASSDLFDVSGFDETEIETYEVTIKRRFWFDTTRTVRRTRLGPVISDIPLLDVGDVRIALRWIGHQPTDEVTAFLKVARATGPQEFQAAFETFGVSAQTMVFADSAGNIGQVLAAQLPARPPRDDWPLVLDPQRDGGSWHDIVTTSRLPRQVNPPDGIVTSANNQPPAADVPIGFFFSDDDRVRRLRQMLLDAPSIGVDDLKALQLDTRSIDAARMARTLSAMLSGHGEDVQTVADTLAAWDGDYAVDARGPVVFELMLHGIVPALYGFDDADQVPTLTTQWSYLTEFLLADLVALPTDRRVALLRQAALEAAEQAERFPRWGDMHTMRVAHALSSAPLIGGRFVLDEYPVGGSRETPMKTAHGLVDGPHRATYGSQARHISDLADPDANYFVLFGGTDGWLGSANFADQIPLWRQGDYIRVPLTPATVRREFRQVMTLRPAKRTAAHLAEEVR